MQVAFGIKSSDIEEARLWVERATGLRPALPPHMADLMERKESFTVLPNEQAAVERFIRERARAVKGAAA